MVNSRYVAIVFACGSFLNASAQAYDNPKHPRTWFEAPDVGWSWYIDPPLRKKQTQRKNKDQQSYSRNGASSNRDSLENDSKEAYIYTKQMEKVRKDFEELQAKAILNPTLENVENLQKAQSIIMDRSTSFEKAWMMASLLSGENYRESDQPSPMHRKIYQEKTDKQLEENIHALAKTYGLFFIFKHECPYCHEMAPVVKELGDRYGFNIKAISPDGKSLEGFPDAVKDNGAIAQINPEGAFPMVFLVNPHSGQTIPLARGLISPSEFKDNFRVIIQFLKEQTNAR